MRDVTLYDLADTYSRYLCDETIVITTTTDELYILSACKEHFCHLIGLHKLKLPANFPIPIKGLRGFDAIMNGTLTFEVIRRYDPKGLKELIDRFLYFYFVYQMIELPKAFEFNPLRIYRCTIKGDLMFGMKDQFGGESPISLHFFWIQPTEIPIHIPMSFIVERFRPDLYFKNQTVISVKSIKKVPRCEFQSEINSEIAE